ncbi:Cysteine desulfurase [Prochlorococcus sp. SS52]|uniref:Cysteine desulfurase n=2 Tax=Prochlorococcaceae TaxID=2881426 RepID=Q7VED0_PROMA|nr:SufS family cysteine desulfurase [Prochlorococcus marinus]AAP99129.1 Selenocysteine lyase [Prochlorococcus marinus subsp. marinus str. CCMP1375]KGG11602.1 Cysteine desulfurase [Prochlorococcus marinus str. LG]KGG22717.1 Cysteine desulfurase [Prochlorococcus marinus str. SS35]KGG32862.1 Cysteine desulfurase [Prochlorococcus marinus str. SS51]KGG35458.1 Cysteine desulfurase [Prochlorococcus sp. SS52]
MKSKKNLAEITRKDFELFSLGSQENNDLIYLDHAATSQKPKFVIERMVHYYKYENANVHRGAHQLSAKATQAFEDAREITSQFVQAKSNREIVFTRNATEAINLVAYSWGDSQLKEGDEILITLMEHHSNLVPWQLLAKRKGCKLRYIGITKTGELDLNDLKNKVNEKTKLVCLLHVSNTLGTCNPIKKISEIAHSAGALILIDACQSLAHKKINVEALDIDFLAGSSHKLCGPTGCGFLWAKEEILEIMPPFLAGGEMIQDVSLQKSNWSDLPHKFEAGTPAIGEAIGMGAAISYLQSIGLENIGLYEKELTQYLFKNLETIEGIRILGPTPEQQPNRAPLATFYIENIHSNDIAELLDSKNICIRSGHHCCQPIHEYYGISSTARASLSFTSTKKEIDFFTQELMSSINFIKEHS